MKTLIGAADCVTVAVIEDPLIRDGSAILLVRGRIVSHAISWEGDWAGFRMSYRTTEW